MPAFSLSDDLEFAGRLADAARAAILPYFRAEAGLENKLGETGFDPVTLADRASEAAMRSLISAERPDDGILGEEFPPVDSRNGRLWTLDPIDGTRGFIAGFPTWTVLIALDDGPDSILGMIDQPYIGERFTGSVSGAVHSRSGLPDRIPAVSGVTRLDGAILASTDPYLFEGAEAEAFARLRAAARLTRFGHDAYAYACLASGQIDLVVESGLQPFDVRALIPVVTAAGGVLTNWRGGPAGDGGQVVAAATPELHATALDMLASAAR
ncbi:inositol monophosphatase family protein [Hyphobacterium marinum]|uniref:Inositol monophosphatase family protein n=1 Tax=Hyphobacterium marinum TaxID=3116574 RepID=A0ABU7LY63_9PROT|nr:inositol monophosphatase family protein [Hyphobacterium sp. Y6023]MEE2566498.1 inositol monophosphatase family protein [Hyphobacterium sp. Y6023]